MSINKPSCVFKFQNAGEHHCYSVQASSNSACWASHWLRAGQGAVKLCGCPETSNHKKNLEPWLCRPSLATTALSRPPWPPQPSVGLPWPPQPSIGLPWPPQPSTSIHWTQNHGVSWQTGQWSAVSFASASCCVDLPNSTLWYAAGKHPDLCH